MIYINYLIVVIFSTICTNIARCSLIVEIEMVSFTSDGRLDHNGVRCDSSSCDNYFKLCVISNIPGNCVKTDIVFRNKDSFIFPSELPNHNTSLPFIPNPFEIHISDWPTNDADKVITLEVYDWDKKEDDLLYRNSTNISGILTTENDSTVRILENKNGKTSTTINVRLYCEDGFTGPGCSQVDTACYSTTCLNKGKCIETGGPVQCKCAGGFSGDRCETSNDPCKIGNCKHGNCTARSSTTYTCECFQGYTGDDCDQDIDECQNSPCQYNGTCVNLEPGFRCECPPGRSGELCALDEDECASSPCLNNGTCTHGIGHFECQCVAGFQGDLCEINVNECNSSPCMNGGTCVDEVNRHNCICLEGFDGSFCENNNDKCSSAPCQNGGSCVENSNGYECNCPHGFMGPVCEVDIDECSSEPCQNGGCCTDQADGYVCDCPRGFEGLDCDVNIDDCAGPTSPCLNGGTCVDGVDIFACECQDTFLGNRCEFDFSKSGIPISVEDPQTLDLTELQEKLSDLIREYVPGADDVVVQAFVPPSQNQQDLTKIVFVVLINNTLLLAENDADQIINSIPERELAKYNMYPNTDEGAIDTNDNDLPSSDRKLLEGMVLGLIVFQAVIILLILIRWRRKKRYEIVQRQEETTDETSQV